MMRCICYKIPKCAPPKLYYDIIKYTITVTIYRTTTEGTVYDLRACVITTTEWEGLGTHEAGTGLKPSDLESDNCKRGQSKKKKKWCPNSKVLLLLILLHTRDPPRTYSGPADEAHSRYLFFFIFFPLFQGRTHGDFIICLFAYLFIYLCAPNFYRHHLTIVASFPPRFHDDKNEIMTNKYKSCRT